MAKIQLKNAVISLAKARKRYCNAQDAFKKRTDIYPCTSERSVHIHSVGGSIHKISEAFNIGLVWEKDSHLGCLCLAEKIEGIEFFAYLGEKPEGY